MTDEREEPIPASGGFRSVCVCGHEGDNYASEHSSLLVGPEGWEDVTGFLEPGHGRCNAPGCPCARFTWMAWT